MVRYLWYRARYFLHMFQQVGYKQNEYVALFRNRHAGQLLPLDVALISLITLSFVFVGLNQITETSRQLIIDAFVLVWLSSIRRYKPEKEKKPLVWTARVKRLSVPFFTFLGIASWRGVSTSFTHELFIVESLAFTMGLVVPIFTAPIFLYLASYITKPVEYRIHESFKNQARKKLSELSHVKVIGITGSYGKTSIKFFIRDLLKERFNVLVTPGSFNTPMGICKVINNDLNAQHQILVLEMGARYEGNIDELGDIAAPDISVWSNVGKAHLETFGSQEAIAQTKAGIIRKLKSGGLAVVNGEDPRIMKHMRRRDIQVVTTGMDTGTVRAENLRYDSSGCHFDVILDNERESFSIPVLGKHNVQNLLLAVGVAHSLGIRLKTLAVAAKSIQQVEHRLELKKQGEITVIDDAFNSNPVGAANAIDVLKAFEGGRKIVITPGMIELGDQEEEENRNFGMHMGRAGLDLILLVGKQRTQPIFEGILETAAQTDHVQQVSSLFEANDVLRSFAKPGDIVLYENDLPDSYNE